MNPVSSSAETRSQSPISTLNLLAEEISDSIIYLSDATRNGQRWFVEEELKQLKVEASRYSSTEAIYSLILFRKYAEIATEIKEAKYTGGIPGIGELSLTSVENNDTRLLVGLDAVKTNIFWFRVFAAVLAFVSFVLMSTVPGIQTSDYRPGNHFLSDCYYRWYNVQGSFNMRPYQLVIAVGVLVYIHCLLTAMYYLLPVNREGVKYVPGLTWGLQQIIRSGPLESAQQRMNATREVMNTVYDTMRKFSKLSEVFFDALYVLLLLVAVLMAAVYIEQPTRFYIYDPAHGHNDGTPEIEYYSIGTFYATYSSETPECLHDDPLPRMRASLAMLFFTLAALSLCLQISYRSFRREMVLRRAPVGRNDPNDESGRPFFSQPLATSEEEGEEDESGQEDRNNVPVDIRQGIGYNDRSENVKDFEESAV